MLVFVRYVSFLGHVAYLQFSLPSAMAGLSGGLKLRALGAVLLNDANEIRSRI